MKPRTLKQRPPEFRLNANHPLANGLWFGGFATNPGSERYLDSSPYRRHGVLTSMSPGEDWQWIPNLNRMALYFDGVNQYAATSQAIRLNTGAFSAGGWTYCDAANLSADRVWLGGSSTNQFYIDCGYSGHYVGIGGSAVKKCANAVVRTWQHFTFTYDADTQLLTGYSDGTYFNEHTGITAPANSDIFLRVGNNSALNYDFVGFVCDPFLYGRILSLAEISQLADPSNVMLSGLLLPPRRRLFRTAVGGPAALDCSIEQTLPKLAQAASADVDVSAAIAQTLPKLAQSASADVDVSGTIAQTLPKLAQAATTDVDVSAAIAQTLPKLAQSALAGGAAATKGAVLQRRAARKQQRRPQHFRLDNNHPLSHQLLLAGLGNAPGSLLYHDSSTRRNSGLLTNMDPATDWVWEPSLNRFVLDLDGTDDTVVIGAEDIALGTVHSAAMWIASTDSAAVWLGGNSTYYLFSPDATTIYYSAGANYAGVLHGGLTASFRHFAVVRDGTSVTFFINGAQAGTTQTLAGNSVYSSLRRIGSYSNDSFFTSGKVADVLVYSRTLSSGEISQLANPANFMLSGLLLPVRRRMVGSAGVEVPRSAAIDQTLPKLGQAAAADVDVSASSAQTLPKLGQSSSVDVDVSASAAQTLPRLQQSVSAAVLVAAQINQTLPKLAQDALATTAFGFTGAQTLPKIGQAASADVDVSASTAQTLPKLAQSLAADVDVSATAAQTLPKLAQAGNLLKPAGFSGAQTLPKLSQSATADVDVSATAAQTLPKLRQRAQIGETPTATGRTFLVPPRTSTFIVPPRTSTFIVT